jgi:hypothetical protein
MREEEKAGVKGKKANLFESFTENTSKIEEVWGSESLSIDYLINHVSQSVVNRAGSMGSRRGKRTITQHQT